MLLKRLANRSALSDLVVLCNLCETIRRTLHTCRKLRCSRVASVPFQSV